MSLRCRPGDLAVIVAPRLSGQIVRVIALDTHPAPCGRPAWLYEGDVRMPDYPALRYESLWDHILQPIRDNDGEDEMLSIARKNAHDSAITEQQERLTRLLEEVPKQ